MFNIYARAKKMGCHVVESFDSNKPSCQYGNCCFLFLVVWMTNRSIAFNSKSTKRGGKGFKETSQPTAASMPIK
jgi:hypothetical protein